MISKSGPQIVPRSPLYSSSWLNWCSAIILSPARNRTCKNSDIFRDHKPVLSFIRRQLIIQHFSQAKQNGVRKYDMELFADKLRRN